MDQTLSGTVIVDTFGKQPKVEPLAGDAEPEMIVAPMKLSDSQKVDLRKVGHLDATMVACRLLSGSFVRCSSWCRTAGTPARSWTPNSTRR
jgi:hypothetical protein